jgi:hypothetical protein
LIAGGQFDALGRLERVEPAALAFRAVDAIGGVQVENSHGDQAAVVDPDGGGAAWQWADGRTEGVQDMGVEQVVEWPGLAGTSDLRATSESGQGPPKRRSPSARNYTSALT